MASLGKFFLVFSQVCIYDAETSDALPPPPSINHILAFELALVLYFNNINPSLSILALSCNRRRDTDIKGMETKVI